MSSSDIFDVLNIKPKSDSLKDDTTTGKHTSSLAVSDKNTPVPGTSSIPTMKSMAPKPQVTGIQRELYNLLGENQPPIMVQPVNRFKQKMTGKPSPWTYSEFWSTDDEDTTKRVKLRHWVKGSKELIGETPQVSSFSKFNQHLTLPQFTEEEYNSFMKAAKERKETHKEELLTTLKIKDKPSVGRDRYIPYVKTIPKKTGIAGTVCHECQVMPSMNDPNYHKIVEQRRNIVKFNNKEKITTLDETVGVTMSHTGMSMKSDTSNFLKVGREKAKSNVKSIRMPKKEILDYLFKLFDEYDYWSLKGLKERTRQPEAHLKECLDKVATLVKKGPYAFKYTLRPEYKKLKEEERKATLGELADENQPGSSTSPSSSIAADGTKPDGEEDDEDEIEMEDIV